MLNGLRLSQKNLHVHPHFLILYILANRALRRQKQSGGPSDDAHETERSIERKRDGSSHKVTISIFFSLKE